MDPSAPKSQKRRDVLVVAIVAIIAVMLGANLFMLIDDGAGRALEGAEAPGFELPVFGTDEQRALREYRGQVVVIDFWATWCPPCRDQMPALEKLANDPALADEVAVLSINTDPDTDDRADQIQQFLDEEELTLPTLVDTGAARSAYRVATIPTLVVVDPAGTVVHVSEGVHDEDTLRALVAEASSNGG